MKSTNYLNPTMFYNEFLDYLVLLDEFHSNEQDPPMSANQFYFLARIQYGSALRITEGLNLTPNDFDLEHRILTTVDPKSNKGGVQKTTILPYDVKPIDRFISKFSQHERIAPITRSTAWRYYKNASKLAGLKLFEAKDEVEIVDAWTHLLRSSCAKMYISLGASESLVSRKLRHHPANVTQRYTKVDLQSVLDFEDEHLQKCVALPSIEPTHEKPLIEVVQ